MKAKISRGLSLLSVNFIRYTLFSITLISCASVGLNQVDLDQLYGKVFIPERIVPAHSSAGAHYLNTIEPLLEKRCVACHGCYDAACQLKLSSPAGISRGASQQQVYDGTRIVSATPSRLNFDAHNTEQWRDRGFHPVLNERSQTPEVNLQSSLLYQMLNLKQTHPLPKGPLLPPEVTVGINRESQCANPQEFSKFAEANPLWGMPYGLPALSKQEHSTLQAWLENGAAMAIKPLPAALQTQVEQWEAFLNQTSNKHQLTARYVYEHLFLGHLYFSNHALFNGTILNRTTVNGTTFDQESLKQKPEFFFKLVRSSTPPGLPIRILPSRRPYHDPGVSQVYYRLQQVHGSIPSKIFMPYALNNERMRWIKELFIQPQYSVDSLPGYDEEATANPLLTFKDLPIGSRYRFMLEEAEFIIKGFIKGPVCRGQIALNVIDDHFWVSFIDPQYQSSELLNNFLVSQADNLKLPGETAQKTQNVVKWLLYSRAHERFLEAKGQVISDRFDQGKDIDLSLVWNGGKSHNPNAALTIFRHFDSATVIKGHIGQTPKTAWLIGYPLLERIHYLLVAQFDVYGNISHQLLTRLYMDFLRMEGEYNFLAFLPQTERERLVEHWYRGADSKLKEHLGLREKHILQTPNIEYHTDDLKQELLNKIHHHLDQSIATQYAFENDNAEHQAVQAINKIEGPAAFIMPEIALLKVENQLYTIIKNSGHTNISSLLFEEDNRLPEEDYLTVVPGIVANYPGAFFEVDAAVLSDFISAIEGLRSEQDYFNLMSNFGIRRTDPNFWAFSDSVHQWFEANDPMNSGVLDYNRLENR